MVEKERGKFVVFEGIGGSGKTTQIKLAEKLLQNNGFQVVTTREPGGVVASEKIRNLIFDLKRENLIGYEGQMVLFVASRLLWRDGVVIPNIEKGVHVISDRCDASTNAYQGWGEEGDKNQILKISKIIMGECRPEAVVLFDISRKTSLSRREITEGDPFDEESIEYFDRVVAGYREMAKNNWGEMPWFVVDGENGINHVSGDVGKVLEHIFETKLSY